MTYTIRFAIGNRYGAKSKYSLREFCISIVDRFSLTELEVVTIINLIPGGRFRNADLEIERTK